MTQVEKQKQDLVDAIIYGTCQCLTDYEEFVDNDYVASYIQNTDEELLVEYCEIEGFDVTEDEVVDFMVNIVLEAEPFNVRVEDIDEC